MPIYAQFYPESFQTIKEAFNFVIKIVKEDLVEKRKLVDESHYPTIDKEYETEISTIEKAKEFLEKYATGYGSFQLDQSSHESFTSVISSALEIFLQDTIDAKSKTGLPAFDEKVQEIRRITSLDSIKAAKSDLFSKYYHAPAQIQEGKKVEIFLSYANEDKILAGEIAAFLNKKDIDVFLAHEDIEISNEWRNEILKHLKDDNLLLALLTANYEKSVWANQEAGYMMGKGGKNIPLIVGNTDVKRFGFLESRQGIKVDERNVEDCVDKIVSIVLKRGRNFL